MELFRICEEQYSKMLACSGNANRWNIKDQQVIYTAATRSLASMELIVHRASIAPTKNYKVMVISVADEDHLINQIQIKELPKNWRSHVAYSTLQKIGSAWYSKQESLMLKVPSAVIPYEFNYIINMVHPEFDNKVSLVRAEDYFWDDRLV